MGFFEIAGLALSAFGAFSQYQAGQDAKSAAAQNAAEQRQQVVSQQRIADIKNAQSRAQQAQQQRIASANILSSGANAGVMTSSGVSGGIGSTQTQGAQGLGAFGAVANNQMDILSSQSRQAGDVLAESNAKAEFNTASTMFSLGSTIFDKSGGWKTIFDMNKKAA